MQTRDYTRWNYEPLLDLIEGPFLNPKRLEEVIKLSKFIKRLMSFFHPLSHRFSEVKKTKANLKWVKLGCTLITTLIANPDGLKFLEKEDELLPQISKCFAQLEPVRKLFYQLKSNTLIYAIQITGATTNSDFEVVFSKKKMEETLTVGYFEMLGVLSKNKEGLDLLDKHKIFTAFYHMTELRSREDLIKAVVENLDYNMWVLESPFLFRSVTSFA